MTTTATRPLTARRVANILRRADHQPYGEKESGFTVTALNDQFIVRHVISEAARTWLNAEEQTRYIHRGLVRYAATLQGMLATTIKWDEVEYLLCTIPPRLQINYVVRVAWTPQNIFNFLTEKHSDALSEFETCLKHSNGEEVTLSYDGEVLNIACGINKHYPRRN